LVFPLIFFVFFRGYWNQYSMVRPSKETLISFGLWNIICIFFLGDKIAASVAAQQQRPVPLCSLGFFTIFTRFFLFEMRMIQFQYLNINIESSTITIFFPVFFFPTALFGGHKVNCFFLLSLSPLTVTPLLLLFLIGQNKKHATSLK